GVEGSDPSRLAAQIASGVGFLGAGTIIHLRDDVRGLTTAAAIWVAAALGTAAGAGLFILSLGGAVVASIVLGLLPSDLGPTQSASSPASEDDLDEVDPDRGR